jgi:hypothetical protein
MSEVAFSTTGEYDSVCDERAAREKHTSDLICICGTCIVRIYLLRCRTLVEADKALEEVLARGVVVGTAIVVREIIA